MNKISQKLFWSLCLVFISACQPGWALQLKSSRLSMSFTQKDFNKYKKEYSQIENCQGLPLNDVLYRSGFEIIDSVEFNTRSGGIEKIDWNKKGEEGCINALGQITFGSQKIDSNSATINEISLGSNTTRILDIPPTALAALGITPQGMAGKKIIDGSYSHVVLIYLDGFGYSIYENALTNNLLHNLTNNSSIKEGITVYPPRTSVVSAAILTGLPPIRNGVIENGIRNTDTPTIFDLISKSGKKSIAVEGQSLAFNLRNTKVILSGDRDLNGNTDDNVFANAEEVINTEMPDLLWIHFHGIDDTGHTFGPGSQQVKDKISELDAYYGKITDELPVNTLIITFADHGMHAVSEEGREGNHGNLILSDMVIPVFIETK
jgi:hypothetical protein